MMKRIRLAACCTLVYLTGGVEAGALRASQANNNTVCADPVERPMPTLHLAKPNATKLAEYTADFESQYARFQRLTSGKLRRYDMQAMLDTRLTSVTSQQPATFVFWGQTARGVNEMEAFNHITIIQGDYDSMGVTWSFRKPNTWNEERVVEKTTELPAGDYVAFMPFCAGVFAHFVSDMVGYLALMREYYLDSPNTKFILADYLHQNEERMKILDPDFNARVAWVSCEHLDNCHQKFTVQPGGSLTLLTPHRRLPIRHLELFKMARNWLIPTFNQRHAPDPTASPLVVYYTRNSQNAYHGRALDRQQEAILLFMLQKAMNETYQHETDPTKVPKLYIFDGTEPFEQQIRVFQRATVIVGPHGGGMANIFWAGADCGRPKVLEFLVDPQLTPEVQSGGYGKTYHTIMSTAPWVEYHHILYQPPSNEETTFISLFDFHYAISDIFGLDPTKKPTL